MCSTLTRVRERAIWEISLSGIKRSESCAHAASYDFVLEGFGPEKTKGLWLRLSMLNWSWSYYCDILSRRSSTCPLCEGGSAGTRGALTMPGHPDTTR